MANHGCSAFCGYGPTKAGEDWLCLPSSAAKAEAWPFAVDEQDAAELCDLVARNSGCCETCGFVFDARAGGCRQIEAVARDLAAAAAAAAAEPLPRLGTDEPIIGGQGAFRYQYMPDLLQAPAGAVLNNCHGLVTDKDDNIILTYQHGGADTHCLIRWNPDGTGGAFASKEGDGLCGGVPHGLKITTEGAGGEQFLYHANNAQMLAKTTLEGEIVWKVDGNFGQNDTCVPDVPAGSGSCPNGSCNCANGKLPYIPTWFATPPNSKYAYLCDGYGSDHVYAFEAATGTYMNRSWGGRSPAGLHPGYPAAKEQPHGKFMENHGCTWDPRNTTAPNTIVVSDRRNMRFEFFHYDPDGYDTFEWYLTVDMAPSLGEGTLPCNMRMYPEQDGRSVVPDLAGPVAILDSKHEVLSVVNVSVLLAAEQHKHPHDAILLPNGDLVVATWAPGRISYWKLLPPAPPTPAPAPTPAPPTCGNNTNNSGATNTAIFARDACACRRACENAPAACKGWTWTAGQYAQGANNCFLRTEWGHAVDNCGTDCWSGPFEP